MSEREQERAEVGLDWSKACVERDALRAEVEKLKEELQREKDLHRADVEAAECALLHVGFKKVQ